MNGTAPARPLADRRTATVVMACLGVFVAYLPVMTVAVSLTAIQRALGATTSQLSWVQDAFVLPMAALILTAGVFGDVYGRKKVFQAGLVFCALGAAVGLSAHSIQVVWAGQVLAGMGAAALLPATLALISHAVPDPRERGKFIGLWATAMLGALAVGSIVAGVIVEHVSWRWIYLLPIPLALLVAGFAVGLLTDSRAPHARRLDWPGQITAAVGIVALVYGTIEGGAGSFGDARVIVAFAVAVVSLVAFVLVERRSADPMLDLSLLRNGAFAATALVAVATFVALIGSFFVMSLFFGMVQRLGTLDSAWRLFLGPLAAMLVGAPVGALMHRVPARVIITGGLLVVTAALLSLATMDATTTFWGAAWRELLLGAGMGAVLTPMTAGAVSAVPHRMAGMAAAGNNAFRQLGGALGPALLGALLTTRALSALPSHLAGVSSATRQTVLDTADAHGLSAVAGLHLGADTARVYAALGDSMVDGLRLCMLLAAALTLLAAVSAAILLRPARAIAASAADARPVGAPVLSAVPDQTRAAAAQDAVAAGRFESVVQGDGAVQDRSIVQDRVGR